MELEYEGLIGLEDVHESPILGAKYGKVEIKEIIKDDYSQLDLGKQRQLRDVFLKHKALFDRV